MKNKIIALVVLIIVLVVVVVLNKKAAPLPSPENLLQVKELGITIPLSSDIKDLTYAVTNIPQIGNVAYFTSSTLKTTNAACVEGTLGAVNVANIEALKKLAPNETLEPIKKIGETGIYYTRPQATCSPDEAIQQVVVAQILSLESALRNAVITTTP